MGASLAATFLGAGSLRVRDSDFIQNSSLNGQGGAAWIDGTVVASFVNCRFVGNEGLLNGGALYCGHAAHVSAVNCIFSGNVGGFEGSAITLGSGPWGGSLAVRNCSFSQNKCTASSGVGGAIAGLGGDLTVTNCVLFENSDADPFDPFESGHLWVDSSTTKHISYCCFFPLEFPIYGNHHIFSDPLLADPNGLDDIVGTADDNLELNATSPCIDAGNNELGGSDLTDFDADGDVTEAVPIDLAGRPRFIDRPDVSNSGVGVVPIDIGAYETSNWVALGHGLEGTHGVPWLLGHGDWFPDEVVSLDVSNARESSLAALLLGDSVVLAPFKGGVLVPSPLLAFLIRTGPNGEFSLSDSVPRIAVPVTVALQVWIADPEAPEGASATAGFTGTLTQ